MSVGGQIKLLGVLDRNGQYPRLIGGRVCVGVERFPGCSKRRERLVYLSQRQKEVLKLMGDGLCTKEVAGVLRLSPKTIEYHRAVLYQKLGVSGIPLLIKTACRLKLSRL